MMCFFDKCAKLPQSACLCCILLLSPLILGDNVKNLDLNQEDIGLNLESLSPPKPGWIDPFDMLGESYSQRSLYVQSDVEIHVLEKRCNSYEVHLRRFVNMFLNAVNLKEGLGNTMNQVKLEFVIDKRDLQILKDFGLSQNDAKIEYVSDVFTKIFSQKTPQDKAIFILSDLLVWSQKVFLKILSSPEWTVLSSISLLMFLTLWFFYHTHSYRLAIFTILLTIFLAGFGFTWIRMYEEKEVERYVNVQRHGVIPKHCSSQSQTMVWYEHVYYRMFGEDCHEFFKIRDVRPMVKVSPTDVLAETISSMIIKPATNIGTAYGNFVASFTESLPWYLKPFGLTVSFAIPLAFVTIVIALSLNYGLSLSITGFHLTPTWSRSSHKPIGRGNKYIEEVSHDKVTSSQQNSNQIPFLDSDTPLFVMNWKGLKKLSSSSLSDDKGRNRKDSQEIVEDTVQEEVQPLGNETENMIENLKEFEEFVESMEAQKIIEDRKIRSIHTCSEREHSLSINRIDSQNTITAEHKDVSSGDGKGIPVDTVKRKDKDI